MNIDSIHIRRRSRTLSDIRPILIVPYMWIGDFVRGHTVVRVLKQRWPNRPVDLLVTSLCAPLVDYMPGVRAGIVWDLPRSRLALAKQWGLAAQFRDRGYGTALVLPRTWKSAIAPALAGIPERVGFVGEVRFGLINHWRWGEKALPRFIDKNAALALPDGTPLPMGMAGAAACRFPPRKSAAGGRPTGWAPVPRWRWRRARSAPPSAGRIIAEAARLLAERGLDVWVVGGPGEKALAAEIVAAGGPRVRDLTGYRPAQRHPGDGGGQRRDLERFRADAHRGRDRNADHGHFRPHQPLSLGAAERPRRDSCRPEACCRASPANGWSAP